MTIGVLGASDLNTRATFAGRSSSEYVDKAGVRHDDFLLYNLDLPAGRHELLIESESGAGSVSVVVLKRASNADEFFAGLRTLVKDDQDASNDFLDIYVRAVWDDATYDSNFGNSLPFGVIRERQCKALNNFFLAKVLGTSYMVLDDVISAHASDAPPATPPEWDWVFSGPGLLIYNASSNPTYGSSSNAIRGDSFVDFAIVSGPPQINHYGLFVSQSEVVDANWRGDGRLRFASVTERNPEKIARPR